MSASAPRPAKPRTVMVVLDSLRDDLVGAETTPHLWKLAGQGLRFGAHRSVFPSTTRTASASLATGCLAGAHGLLGNTMAVDEGAGLRVLSTGKADFRERVRAATGRVLLRPALPELLAGHGGAVIFSNATPGAAHFQDPDGHGFLYNRAANHGPGLRPLPQAEGLHTPKGIAGDAEATGRFVAELLTGRGAALNVLWLSEPDFTGHVQPLGSEAHLEALRAADRCVGRVAEALEPALGDGLLFILTSDHGMETVANVIHVEDELVEAGLKEARDSQDVLPASQGTSATLFVAPHARERVPALLEFLRGREWAGEVFGPDDLPRVGLNGAPHLAAAVTMRRDGGNNPFGLPGRSDIVYEEGGLNHQGCGQHGGTGPREQSPFLVVLGGGFPAGEAADRPSSCIDLAPTILRHHGLPAGQMDGRPLQER